MAHFDCFNLDLTINSRFMQEIDFSLSLQKIYAAVNYLHFNSSLVQTFESKIKQCHSILMLKCILGTALAKLEVMN